MSFAGFIGTTETGMFIPISTKRFQKIGKDFKLPEISPREHRLFIQSPSLARHFTRQKQNLKGFQEAIERSLSRARGENVKIREFLKDSNLRNNESVAHHKTMKSNIKITPKVSGYKPFIVPLKSNKRSNHSPIFSDKTLVILNNQTNNSALTNRPTEVSHTRRISSESDEYKIDNVTQLEYLNRNNG